MLIHGILIVNDGSFAYETAGHLGVSAYKISNEDESLVWKKH